MPMTADNIQLPADLSQALGTTYAKPKQAIGANYDFLRKRASPNYYYGAGLGDYAKERLGTQEGLDTQGLSNSLYANLGNAGYEDWKAIRDFNQKKQLAQETADVLKPSLFEQIMGGLSGGSRAALQGAQLYSLLGSKKGGGTPYPASKMTSPSDLYDLYDYHPGGTLMNDPNLSLY